MDVLLIDASEEEYRLVADALEPDKTVGRLAEDGVDDDWPLAVVMLSPDNAAQEAAAARRRVGHATVLVGVCGGPNCKPEALLDAGLDDLSGSITTFLERYPFLATRLRLRAHRQLRLEAIMENTVDAMVVINHSGVMQSINRAVTRMFGYSSDELLGQNVSMLMPSPYAEHHDEYISHYLETGRARIIGIGREVTGQRKDGSLFPVDLAVSETKIAGQTFFAGVLRDISERRRLESEVLRVGDEERRRIGQDLHDGLGQMLTGIGLIAQNVAKSLRSEGSATASDVEQVAELIREADEQARALARGLVPVELDRNGLATALDRLCSRAERLFGGSCSFEQSEEILIQDGATTTNLFRIAQEAVSNAFKHGHADDVRVCLTADRNLVRLQISDNGVGFPEVLEDPVGMGVRIMHYRASVIGGKLQILRSESGGTLVSCDIGPA